MPPMPLSEPEKTGLYPRELETLETLRDGTVVGLRPLHPDDKAALYDLAAHMTAEDVRLRFFTPLHGLPDALVARLLRLDEDRCMALAALHDGAVLGIARYTAEADRRSAEYAIAVRSDWKGRGIGYLLMTRLIEIARRHGIGELVGEVLHENRPMLAMCREFGFSLHADPADPALVVVRKPLS
jgi:acetyltransferase